MNKKTRVAVDIGGTFTDIVLEIGGLRFTSKVLSTPAAPEVALLTGVRDLLQKCGATLADVDIFMHGTTLATNAILERRGALTALLTTAGFRDVLEIGTENRFDQYDLQIERARPLVPRAFRIPIRERMSPEGNPQLPVDLESVDQAVERLQQQHVESVAVSFLHSYRNAAHERLVADFLRARLPGIFISCSSEVCPEIREYERTSTTVANAYVQPIMSSYLGRLADELKRELFAGRLYLVTSSGGLTDIETARKFPVRLVESGPAGGAIFASTLARALDRKRVLCYDMGGTTAKVTLIKDFEPKKGRTFEVDRTKRFMRGSGLPIRIPVIEMVEIGAGGGSIAGIDGLQHVQVGPESAGSEPGPACFGKGGAAPTVTDANLVIGTIQPEFYAGGSITMDVNLARQALEQDVGQPLGLSAAESAHAVYEVVCENMANAARAHAVEQGEALADFSMIAFGGAAPAHAARVAEKLGLAEVVIPPDAGVGSAIGFLTAPISYEVVRSLHVAFDAFNVDAASSLLREMRDEAIKIVQPALGNLALKEERFAYVRYIGQNNEIEIPLPNRDLTHTDVLEVRRLFEDAYALQYSRIIPDAPLEILNWLVRISEDGVVAATDMASMHPTQVEDLPEYAGMRDIVEPGQNTRIQVPVYRRSALAKGRVIEGPAIIVERNTTSFVSRSFNAAVSADGSIVMSRKLAN